MGAMAHVDPERIRAGKEQAPDRLGRVARRPERGKDADFAAAWRDLLDQEPSPAWIFGSAR
jgi:hypothetical protein